MSMPTGITTLSIPSDSRAKTAAGSESDEKASNLRRLRRNSTPRPRVARALTCESGKITNDPTMRTDRACSLRASSTTRPAKNGECGVCTWMTSNISRSSSERIAVRDAGSGVFRALPLNVTAALRASECTRGSVDSEAEQMTCTSCPTRVRYDSSDRTYLLHAVGPIDAVIQHQRDLQTGATFTRYLPCAYVCSPWNTKFTAVKLMISAPKPTSARYADLRPAQPCVVRACRYAA